MKQNFLNLSLVLPVICILILSSCKNAGDARTRPPNVKDRVQKNSLRKLWQFGRIWDSNFERDIINLANLFKF